MRLVASPFVRAVASLLVIGLGAPIAAPAGVARAEAAAAPDLAALLPRIGQHAARFEEMKRRGSFTLRGKLEELDGQGRPTATKEIVVRSTATPAERTNHILRYLEDGADKTAEARQKAEKRRAEASKEKGRKKKRDLHLPFLPSEQPRYTFRLVERDPAAPSRVRIAFSPKVAAEDAFEGSAWVDTGAGEILTMGLTPSKTSMFVDKIDVTIEFNLPTPLGRAPSVVGFAASGGLFFFKKRVRASGTLSEPALAF